MKNVPTEIWQCLVREVIRMRIKDRNQAHEFLRMWEAKHDNNQLRAVVKTQWEAGNRGEKGDWK